jgi:hypothetical protein
VKEKLEAFRETQVPKKAFQFVKTHTQILLTLEKIG